MNQLPSTNTVVAITPTSTIVTHITVSPTLINGVSTTNTTNDQGGEGKKLVNHIPTCCNVCVFCSTVLNLYKQLNFV